MFIVTRPLGDVSWAEAWCRQAMRAAGRLPDLWQEGDTRRRGSGPILGHFRERREVQPAGSPHEGNSLCPTNVSSERAFRMVKKLPLKIENRVWTMAPAILFCPARSTIETLATNTLQRAAKSATCNYNSLLGERHQYECTHISTQPFRSLVF